MLSGLPPQQAMATQNGAMDLMQPSQKRQDTIETESQGTVDCAKMVPGRVMLHGKMNETHWFEEEV
jgi:hypothetical protein